MSRRPMHRNCSAYSGGRSPTFHRPNDNLPSSTKCIEINVLISPQQHLSSSEGSHRFNQRTKIQHDQLSAKRVLETNRSLRLGVKFLTLSVCCALFIPALRTTITSLSTTSRNNDHQLSTPNVTSTSHQSIRGPDSRFELKPDLPLYTREMAAQAIRQTPWTCGDPTDSAIDPITNEKPIFAFVHIYKTAGSTLRSFFQAYSYICRKTWMCLIGCTDADSSSLSPIVKGTQNWKRCKVKNVLDRNGRLELDDGWTKTEEGWTQTEERVYPFVNNTILRTNVDIFGGHFRIGTGDYILNSNQNNIHPVRHIIFLRDPMERFISGILYETRDNTQTHTGGFISGKLERQDDINSDPSLNDTVEMIKKRVHGSRKADEYWCKSLAYLLTPSQNENMKSVTKKTEQSIGEHHADNKARMVIENLVKYNVIVGTTDRMIQSMEILQHILVSDRYDSFSGRGERESSIRNLLNQYSKEEKRNESNNGKVSTASVLKELKKDEAFMSIFERYVKFERMITDYATQMHLLQYELIEGHPEKRQSRQIY